LSATPVVEGQPHPIADAAGIQRCEFRRIEDHFFVAHQHGQVQPSLVRGGQQAQ
jgi:hypothetical protein